MLIRLQSVGGCFHNLLLRHINKYKIMKNTTNFVDISAICGPLVCILLGNDATPAKVNMEKFEKSFKITHFGPFLAEGSYFPIFSTADVNSIDF